MPAPQARAESVIMHAMGVRHAHRRGAPSRDKLVSVVVSLGVGLLVGPFVAWGLLEVMEARLANRAGTTVPTGALAASVVGGAALAGASGLAARRSGVGLLIGGVMTVVASVIGLADRAIGHGIAPDSLPPPLAFTLLIVFGFGTLLPLAACLIGLGPASAIAGHRVPGRMLLPSIIVCAGILGGLSAGIWAGTRIHAEIAPLGYLAIRLSDIAIFIAGLVITGLATAFGGRGAPGLIAAGAALLVLQIAFLAAPETTVTALPGWVVRSLDIPGLLILPIVGVVLIGGGLGLLMRRSAVASNDPG